MRVISDNLNDHKCKLMLTVGGVSSSGPGLLTETICIGIGDTIVEAGRKFGGESVSTSTDG